MTAIARFFEMPKGLPSTFKIGNVKKAGDLPSTTIPPSFWISSGAYRMVQYVNETGTKTLKTVLLPFRELRKGTPEEKYWRDHSIKK